MSYVSSFYHCVFSTKERRPPISPELSARLYPFLGGIARQHRMKILEIGGMPDHVHLLLALPAPLSIAKALQLIKGGFETLGLTQNVPSGQYRINVPNPQ